MRHLLMLAFGLAPLIPGVAGAQESAPRAGSWGAETDLQNDVNVLRFRSTTSAWLIGFSAFYFRQDEEGSSGLEGEATSVALRLGLRSYRAPASRVRPFLGLAGILGFADDAVSERTWLVGGQFETGAHYFFTSHVSLGTSFDLRLLYGKGSRDAPFGETFDVTSITVISGLRLLGAVYF